MILPKASYDEAVQDSVLSISSSTALQLEAVVAIQVLLE